MYKIYTDGSCKTAEGEGGWAFVILKEGEIVYEDNGYEPVITAPEAEVKAICEALMAIIPIVHNGEEIVLYSDCRYAVKGASSWMYGWRNKDWKNSRGKTVAHVEYWQCINKLSNQLNIFYKHVKAHNGVEWNEYVDEVARQQWKEK